MPKLTDRTIKTAKPEGKDLFISDGGGLYLRVTVAGSKIWIYRYKNEAGIQRWPELGMYPVMSLAEARAEALRLKAQRRSGIDPVEERQRLETERKATEAAQAARLTVSELFEKWFRQEASRRKDGGKEVRRIFEKDVLGRIGGLPAEAVKKSHVSAVLEQVQARGGNGRLVVVVLAGMRQMFGFAVEHDLMEADPTAGLRKGRLHKPTERDRALSQSEVRTLIEKLPHAHLSEQSQLAVLALLATSARIGELFKTKLSSVDLDRGVWIIPASDSKSGRQHAVSLSSFALGIFKQLHGRAVAQGSAWLLPSPRASKDEQDKPALSASLSKSIGERQRGTLEPLKNRTPHTDALILPGGRWTAHDLRRTSASLMAELGVQPHVVERCLSHVEENKLIRTYQRVSYEAEQRQAWQLLGDRLALLTAPESNVVTLQPRAA